MQLLRPTCFAARRAIVAGAPLLLACSEPTAVGSLSLRLGPPNFDGVLTAAPVAPQRQWMIERASTGEPCDDVVAVGVDDAATVVLRADGSRASVADLGVGQRVSVWFTPVMLLSCPGQTGAKAIVLR